MNPTITLARIHAHLCGDGHVSQYRSSEKDHKIRAEVVYTNKNPSLRNDFRKDMTALFGVKMTPGPKYEVRVRSKRIYNALMAFGPYKSREWHVPQFVSAAAPDLKCAWLSAYFQDDAYLEKRYDRLKIKSVNHGGLVGVQVLLLSLGVQARITGQNCDGTWYLTISKLSTTMFADFRKSPARKKK